MSASNAGRAKSGVPMKITRMRRRIASGPGGVKTQVREPRRRLYAPEAPQFRLKAFKDAEFMVKAIRAKSVFDLRVYYEDTDFSGRVYHASYLRFLERGRTEWLRALGFDHSTLAGEAGLIFAVRGLQIEYLAPALMDDLLTVETEFGGTRGALIEFNQQILRR